MCIYFSLKNVESGTPRLIIPPHLVYLTLSPTRLMEDKYCCRWTSMSVSSLKPTQRNHRPHCCLEVGRPGRGVVLQSTLARRRAFTLCKPLPTLCPQEQVHHPLQLCLCTMKSPCAWETKKGADRRALSGAVRCITGKQLHAIPASLSKTLAPRRKTPY